MFAEIGRILAEDALASAKYYEITNEFFLLNQRADFKAFIFLSTEFSLFFKKKQKIQA